MLTAISKKEKHISAFYQFLKGTHPKAHSDVKFLPRDVLEIILKEYVFKSFDYIEMIECGLNTFFYQKMYIEPNLLSENYIQGSVMACITHGNVEVLTWLFDEAKKRNVKIKSRNLIDVTAKHGHLHVIKFLHTTYQEIASAVEVCTSFAMDWAAGNGYLDVVMWLQNNRSEGCTYRAMDSAAYSGHLHVVEWLHENRNEGCTHRAMDWAASKGYLHVVEWLHFNRTEGCTSHAMDYAAFSGHLHVVKFLHKNRTEGCSTYAMNMAARNGHLEVVEWLHFNRSEGCTTEAMDLAAAENGHLRIIKFLHEHRTEGCTEKAKIWALKFKHAHVLEWLRVHYPQFFDEENERIASQA